MACRLANARGPALLLAAFLVTTVSSAQTPDRLELMFEAAAESITPWAQNQLAVAREDLAQMDENAAWTPEDRESARQWLDSLVSGAPRRGMPTGPMFPLPGTLQLLMNGRTPHPLLPPADAFANQLIARLQAIEWSGLRARVVLHEHVTKLADVAWLSAKSPDDLTSILEILDRLQRLFYGTAGAIPRMAIQPIPSSPAGPRVTRFGAAAMSAKLLLSGPEPLLFPDPEKYPADYLRARQRWHQLTEFDLAFFNRPAVRIRLAEYDGQLEYAAHKVRRELDERLLQNASPTDLGEALARLETFRDLRSSASNQHLRRPSSGPPNQANLPDYRPLLEERPFPPPQSPVTAGFAPAVPGETLDAYKACVSFLSHEFKFAVELATSAGELRRKLNHLDPVLRSFMEDRIAKTQLPSKAQFSLVGLPASTPPAAALPALLEALAGQQQDGAAAGGAREILQGWRGWEAEDAGAEGHGAARPDLARHGSVAHGPARHEAWRRVAEVRGGAALFVAREEAAREILRALGGAADAGPLAPQLRTRLEAAVSAGDLARAWRLFALDRAACILDEPEQSAWTRDLQLLELAGRAKAGGQPEDARAGYQQVLRTTTSAAVAQTAARDLQALPKARLIDPP